jgi:hypothetical protein
MIDAQQPDQPSPEQPSPDPSLPYLHMAAPTTPAGQSEPGVAPPAVPAKASPITEFHIGDEFGTAKRNLPPAGIVLICLAVVAVVVGVIAFHGRAKPQGAGSVDFVTAAEVPDQNMVLAAITLTLRDTASRPLWIHTLKAELTTADGHTYEDEAGSAVDLERYFRAFPALKESAEPPLSPEMKLLAGASQKGTIMVSFPVTKAEFDQRAALSVTIQAYDQALPIVLK